MFKVNNKETRATPMALYTLCPSKVWDRPTALRCIKKLLQLKFVVFETTSKIFLKSFSA